MAEGLIRRASRPSPAPSDEPGGVDRAQAPGHGSATTGALLRRPHRRCNPEPPGLVPSAVDHIGNLGADRGEEREDDSLHRGDRREHDETGAAGQAAGFGGASSAVLEQAVADQGATAGQPDAAAGTLTADAVAERAAQVLNAAAPWPASSGQPPLVQEATKGLVELAWKYVEALTKDDVQALSRGRGALLPLCT